MKYQAIYIAIIVCMIWHITYSQNEKKSRAVKKFDKAQIMSNKLTASDSVDSQAISYYYVEEKVNVVGGYTITYKVSKFSMIPTYDLGPNNTRTITAVYKKGTDSTATIMKVVANPAKPSKELVSTVRPSNEVATPAKPSKELVSTVRPSKEVASTARPVNEVKSKLKPSDLAILSKTKKSINKSNSSIADDREAQPEIIPVKSTFAKTTESDKVVYVYPIETYERVAEKGYKSIEIFQKLGNSYFFKGDYVKALKWYKELIKLSADIKIDIKIDIKERYEYSLKAASIK